MNTLTIPKTIHYCWFGKNDLPPLVKKCIKSWHKYLPDYEFKLWDEQSFDITSNKWCQEAYKQKKYAFVADYVRLKVLYEQGGIYLDTDIQLYKSLNPFLSNEAFMGFERDEILSMGVMGFKKNNKIIKELLDYYDQEFNLNIVNKLESNANITTQILSEKYGLSRNNAKQIIENYKYLP
ncbi:glycosyl transferase [Bacteroides fragilis]|nr:glycosyl transferase [Bacteroides fragilis]